MASLFFKHDLAFEYAIEYQQDQCMNTPDLYYVYDQFSDNHSQIGLILGAICIYGNRQCVEYFIGKHPNYACWDYGVMGACMGGHVDIVRQMCALDTTGANLASIANTHVRTLPMLLVMEELSGNKLTTNDYAQIARRALRNNNLELYRYATDPRRLKL